MLKGELPDFKTLATETLIGNIVRDGYQKGQTEGEDKLLSSLLVNNTPEKISNDTGIPLERIYKLQNSK